MWSCPSDRDCWHMHSPAGWWCWELSFLPCTLLSASEMCNRVMAEAWTPDKTASTAGWLRLGVSSPSGDGEPVVGRGEWSSASLARRACPYAWGRCVSALADVVAPSVPQLQVPSRVWQSCQQGQVLRLRAHHPQCPRQPLLCCEPQLHRRGDRVCWWWCLPRHSHQAGEFPKVSWLSTGWQRDRLSRELDCRGYSLNAVVQIAKW